MRFITTLTAATLAVTLNAAPEDSATIGGTIDEVSVVGFKQDRASISPVSQQAMGERFIENNQLMGIRDLSGMIANFYMPDYGSRQYSPIYIRGIGSRVNSPSVGVYVDGIPYFDRTVLDMDLFGVSKVEVLRGPQGTLFGRNGWIDKRFHAFATRLSRHKRQSFVWFVQRFACGCVYLQ